MGFASVGEVALTFCFEVVSDLALVPSLLLLMRNRRHFEMFLGTGCLVTALLYNTCNAFGIGIFLEEIDWHKMNNVLTISWILLLAIHIANLQCEMTAAVLRYSVFASVTIMQVRDGFWMEESKWTYIPVIAFVALPIYRQMTKFTAHKQKLQKGLAYSAAAAVCFILNLDINPMGDRFRFWHGMAHVLVGAALWELWGAVEKTRSKSELPLDWC